MMRTSKFIVSLLVAILCQGCETQIPKISTVQAAQFQEAPQVTMELRRRDAVITPALLERATHYAAALRGLYTDPVPCDPIADVCRVVNIQIVQVDDGSSSGNKVCVGLIPEKILFGTISGVAKRIVWQIIPPTQPDPANSTFEFYDEKDHGIVVLNDVNPVQLKNGKLGNGNSGNKDPSYYNMMNSHNKKVSAYYLPIVVQKVPASSTVDKKVALCGTPDPRILND
jgi:hypothetical protein